MKILVTGASGFIGSFMVEEALRRGMDTWAGVRASSSRAYLRDSRIRFAELDLGRADVLEKQLLRQRDEAGPWDYVIHCAGATKCRRTEDFDRINYEGTCHLARLLASTGMMPRQFIFISSLSVYGPVHEQDYAPISDHDTPRPDTAYGKSKLRAEQFLQASPADFPYVIFRPTGVYGPRERDYFLMAKSIDRHVDVAVGFRRQDLTFVFVKDLVQAVFRAIDRGVDATGLLRERRNGLCQPHFLGLHPARTGTARRRPPHAAPGTGALRLGKWPRPWPDGQGGAVH